MGKIAFVFSGQGDQYTGMGRALYDAYPAARAVFEKSDSLRGGTAEMCFSSDAETLGLTENTQPCLFAVEMATAAVLTEMGIRADMTAGFSLGEMAALTYADAWGYETGFSLTCRRAEHMSLAAREHPASMAAVLRLSGDEVRRICGEFCAVYPVNFNCPGQVAVSAEKEEMRAFCEAVKNAGGRAIPLKVSGGFHSPFMKDAAERFEKDLENITFETPNIPVYSDVTALPYESVNARQLAAQISSPVLFEDIVRHMIASSVDTFIEIGPGKTLSGLIAKTDKNVRVFATGTVENIETIKAEVVIC